MKPVAYLAAAAAFIAVASAQQADPALEDLNAAPAGPSELDILSRGAVSDFPDIDKVAKRKPVSVTLRALNKVTAKYVDIVVNMNETANYGSLELTPRYCDKRPPEEFPETTAFLEIVNKGGARQSDFKAGEIKTEALAPAPEPAIEIEGSAHQEAQTLPENMLFSGWMFASSPALNGLEHPVYDVWVIDCNTVSVDN